MIVSRLCRISKLLKAFFIAFFLTVPATFILHWYYYENEPLIIVVTPTNKKVQRLADMTRLSQTLMHIKRLHWIVVEDGKQTYQPVENILKRSEISYTYLNAITPSSYGSQRRGWAQRSFALEHIRKILSPIVEKGVVYFADDDNSYDLRLFNKYIRNVKSVGIWPVGLVGGALVETPVVEDGKITGFHVYYGPWRTFPTDMAGFAVNLDFIKNTTATFGRDCKIFESEDCFIKQLNVTLDQVQPFGHDDKDILVWHTKTKHSGSKGKDFGYLVIA